MRGHVLKSRPLAAWVGRRVLFLSAYSIDAKHACRDGHRYRPAAEEEGGSFFRCLRANVAAVTGGRAEERWKWL